MAGECVNRHGPTAAPVLLVGRFLGLVLEWEVCEGSGVLPMSWLDVV